MKILTLESSAHNSDRTIIIADNPLQPELVQITSYNQNNEGYGSSINREQAIELINYLGDRFGLTAYHTTLLTK